MSSDNLGLVDPTGSVQKTHFFVSFYLNVGTGKPWPGHNMVSIRPEVRSRTVPLLSVLKRGRDPPTGS